YRVAEGFEQLLVVTIETFGVPLDGEGPPVSVVTDRLDQSVFGPGFDDQVPAQFADPLMMKGVHLGLVSAVDVGEQATFGEGDDMTTGVPHFGVGTFDE